VLKIYIIFGRKRTPQKMDHVRVERKEKQTNDKYSNLESEIEICEVKFRK